MIITNLIVSIAVLYTTILLILYGFYTNASHKIEESLKYFNSDAGRIPTEEQIRMLEQYIKENKENISKTMLYHYDINITRYKLITKAVKILTLGLFKHVV